MCRIILDFLSRVYSLRYERTIAVEIFLTITFLIYGILTRLVSPNQTSSIVVGSFQSILPNAVWTGILITLFLSSTHGILYSKPQIRSWAMLFSGFLWLYVFCNAIFVQGAGLYKISNLFVIFLFSIFSFASYLSARYEHERERDGMYIIPLEIPKELWDESAHKLTEINGEL